MFFNKNKQEEPTELTTSTKYLIIHYTPCAIVLYHFTGESIYADDSATVSFCDEDENSIEIAGSYTILELNNENDIPTLIDRYRLKESNLPIIEIKVKDFN